MIRHKIIAAREDCFQPVVHLETLLFLGGGGKHQLRLLSLSNVGFIQIWDEQQEIFFAYCMLTSLIGVDIGVFVFFNFFLTLTD